MKSEFEIAITQLSADRNLAPEVILEAVESALVSAYRKNYGATQAVRVTLDSRTGQAEVYVQKTVVEQVQDEYNEVSLATARASVPNTEVGQTIEVEVKPRDFGRIAAQTAKQVITQRIREAERDSVYLEYADRAGEIVTGLVRNVDARSHNVAVGLGKAEAILPRNEQIPTERYRFNQRLRVYIVSVDRAGQGPQILVSRSHPELLRRLLELEVPEIFNGTVDVKGIAREPGARSKVAVLAMQAGVDPVGSCVGMRGVRIQNIVNELNGEKIDVVAWSPQVETFVANSLSPAKVTSVYLDAEGNTATVVVPDRSLSLAIGKEGQNARLAAKLTGWRIDIRSETEAAEEIERLAAKQAEAKQRAAEREAARRAAEALLAEAEASLAAEGELAIEEEVVAEVEPAVAPVDEAAVVAEEAMAPEVAVVSAAEPEAAPEAKPAEETAPVEAAAPATELAPAVEETASTPAVAGEPAVETEGLEIESEEEEEEDSDGRPKDRTKKRRGQEMVYDERLGRVVARKKHKSGGRRGGWSGDDDEF